MAQARPLDTAKPLDAADLDAWLDGYVPFALQSGDIAGAVVVVVKDGGLLTARGYGWADIAARRPVDPDRTLFRVGSVSKLVTWTAVMQLVEAGKLNLDRDVNVWLDFRIPPLRGQPVTLRQIMTHTAGFEEAGKDVITFANRPIGLDAYLKRWVPARIYAPGTTPAYSNWGAALAGYIVERVSGMPFTDYVEQRIFRPLDMDHSTFRQPLPGRLAPLLALGYPRASASSQRFETIGPAPAGAVSATGADMARFMIAHLEGGGAILSPRTAALMHDSPLDRVDARSLIPPLNRAQLGFLGADINRHKVVGHLGDTQNFHSLFELFVDDHVGIFASFNSAGRTGVGSLARDQLLAAFADRYFPTPPVTTRVDPDTARHHAQLMAGSWVNSHRAETSFLALAALVGQVRVGVTDDGALSIPSLKDAGGAPMRWDEIAPFVWQSRTGHERLAARLEDGQVVRWSVDSLAPVAVFDRAPWWRSSVWLLPALGISLGVLALTVLHWPASWFIRRRYAVPSELSRVERRATRALRIILLLELLVLTGWMILIAAMLSNFDLLSARSDGWLRLLQIGGVTVFVGGVGLAILKAVLTWRAQRHGMRRFWSVATVLATMVVLYFAWLGGLMAMSVNY
ncbi:MAG: serine hydrolase domain-containing protein [Sphingobium sp.]|nr:serine hydrolase domain-containing protein [Sphingobium sp.]